MIDSFKGEFAFLSNFSRIDITVAGKVWPTAEHMFMACKSLNPAVQEQIRTASSPGMAKKLGRQLALRPDWEKIKDEAMLRVLRHKFHQNKEHQQLLLATGEEELIEGNYWHDNYWGICQCPKCRNVKGAVRPLNVVKGKNMLGKLLMQVRKELHK